MATWIKQGKFYRDIETGALLTWELSERDTEDGSYPVYIVDRMVKGVPESSWEMNDEEFGDMIEAIEQQVFKRSPNIVAQTEEERS